MGILNTLIVIRQCLLRLLLKSYYKIILSYGENSSLIGNQFDSEPVYDDNDKYIKT